jgi:hypothetical protein
MLRTFLLEQHLGGRNGINNPAIDGFFIDGEIITTAANNFNEHIHGQCRFLVLKFVEWDWELQ